MKRLLLLVPFILGATIAPAWAVDPSLVLYLPFDEGGGTVAGDASSYANDGAVVGGAQWVTGYSGSALEFVGGSHVTVPEIPEYDVTSQVSLLAWVRCSTVPNWSRVIDKSQWQTTGFDLVLTLNVGLPRLEFFVNNTTSLVDGATVVADGEWHFVVGTFADQTLRVYVDGVLEGEAGSTGNVDINPNDWPLMVGAESSSNGGQQYLGAIDEVAMYNRALSDVEVADIFENGMPVSELAGSPGPKNEAVDVPRDVVLSWAPGAFAAAHDVYFGTSFDDVSAASRTNPLGVLVSQGQTGTTYDPDGLLEFGQSYFWRIDEVNAPPDETIFAGEVWTFTAEAYSYPVANVAATASTTSVAGEEPARAVDGSGLGPDGLHTTNQPQMWLGKAVAGEPVWIQFDFDKVYRLDEMRLWNYNVPFEMYLGFSLKSVTIEYAGDADEWTALGDFELPQGPGLVTYGGTAVDLGGIAAKSVRINVNSNYGVQQSYGLSEVRFYYIPVQAREPNPADGATDVATAAVLSWRAGREATAHDVYWSTDQEAVADGTALIDTVGAPTYDPGTLDLGTTYYWKVNEVNEAATPSVWQGDLWSLTSQEYITVEDFEGYSEEEGNQIFDIWLDGYDVASNGSLIGHENPPYVEESIVHSGDQSAPFYYDNIGGVTLSEATLTLSPAQDWTAAGAQTLVVYLRGSLGNTAAQLYLKVNGTRVDYAGDAAALTAPLWEQWNIDLASLGNAAQNVSTLTVGVSGAGSGLLYLDDIRLYRVAPPAPQAPVDPGTADLVAYYAMENNLSDGSGNGLDGTPVMSPSYEPGPAGYGNALRLDGVSSYAELPLGALIASLSDATFAMWVDFSGQGGPWQRIFDFGSGTSQYLFICPARGGDLALLFEINGPGGGTNLVPASFTLPSGWHHVAGVVDSAGMEMRLYLDGALVGQGPTTSLPSDVGETTQNWLGRSQYTADPYFDGSIDDFRIYDRALSAGELRYLVGAR